MPEIKNVLVTAYIKPENQKKLEQALAPANVTFCVPYGPGAKEKIAQAAKGKDVCILNGDLDDSILASEELKWVHCCRAGVEKSTKPEVFERGIILTSSSGRSAPALAEHALMFMLSLTYDLPMLTRAQKEHKWAVSREYSEKTGMYRKTVGVIGLGKTGSEVARLVKSFDMKVLAWDRRRKEAQNVDQVYGAENGDNLNELLAQCDYVVLSLELNDQTFHIIDAAQLAAMKKTAFLVNMGRGGLVNEPAMIEALKNGGEVIGNRTRAKIVKNKVSPPFREAEFDIMYGEGISKWGELVDLAVKLDILQKSGSWFSMGETRLGQGRDAAKQFLRDNPDMADDLEAKIRQNAFKLLSKQGQAAARAAGRAVDVSADDFEDGADGQ